MRKHIYFYFILILFCIINFSQIGLAQENDKDSIDYAIVISGGDSHPDLQEWMDTTANRFANVLESRGVDPENIQKPTTKDAIKTAFASLKEKKLKCGDNLIIYFIGHGGKDGSLIIGRDSVTTSEMLEWLDSLYLPCCCKIHLARHSCYSEQFVQELMLGNTHVVTGISSADVDRESHHDLRELDTNSGKWKFGGEDWASGLNKNLAKVEESLGWQEALLEAQKTAKTISKFSETDNPATWIRFQGHVVEIIQKEYPTTVKLVIKDGDTLTVYLSSPWISIKVGDMDYSCFEYCVLTVCSQMSAVGIEIEEGKYTVLTNPVVSLNMEGAWGHVEEVDREKGTITVHFEEPEFLKGKTKTIKMNKDSIPDWVETCKWLKIEEGHMDSTFNVESVSEYVSMNFTGHVESVENSWEITVHIMKPDSLKCQNKQVKFKEGIPGWVKVCKWVKFSGFLDNGIINATNIEETDALGMNFTGHVRAVFKEERNIIFNISSPKSMWGQTKIVAGIPEKYFENGGDVKLEKCKWISFTGYLIDDTIKVEIVRMDVISGTVIISVEFKGHVESVSDDRKEIKVLISEPEQIKDKDKEKTVRMKNGETFPEDFKFCTYFLIKEGYMIDDDTIVAKNITVLIQQKDKDAGSKRIVSPESYASAYSSVLPGVVVENFGSESLANFQVTCWIDSSGTEIYRDSKLVSTLHSGDTTNVTFSQWTADAPGTVYEVSFKTKLDNDENPANDKINRTVTIEDTIVTNQPPVLSGGIVIPDTGSVSTVSKYKIIYHDSDGDFPVTYEVVIDSIAYTMDSISGTPLTGMNFQFQTTLNPGMHNFYFRFDDGNGHLVETQVYSGPIVKSFAMNHPPVLTGGDVVPDSGITITPYSYNIIYSDLDGDTPVTYEVIIDSVSYPMSLIGGTPLTGMNYQFKTTLSLGDHNFYFRFNDGHGHIVETPVYSGPIVKSFGMNQPPVLTGGDVVPNSGETITSFSYNITYSDSDGDMPVTYEVIIDSVTTYSMSLIGGTPLTGMNYQFKTTLSLGDHKFYFRFNDGNGHIVLTQTYIGPWVYFEH